MITEPIRRPSATTRQAMADAGTPYVNLPSAALMSLRIATIGELLMLAAAVLAFANFKWHMINHCCACCNRAKCIRSARVISTRSMCA